MSDPGSTSGLGAHAAGTRSDVPRIEHDESSDSSIGELFGRVTSDLSTLVHQEVELAKVEARSWAEQAKGELKAEATKAGRGAGELAGAGVAGNLALVFLSLTAMFALDKAMDVVWAALIVTAVWIAVAAVLALRGKKDLQQVSPVPAETIETAKEDVQWQRSQIS